VREGESQAGRAKKKEKKESPGRGLRVFRGTAGALGLKRLTPVFHAIQGPFHCAQFRVGQHRQLN